jgi:hypothetical protein
MAQTGHMYENARYRAIFRVAAGVEICEHTLTPLVMEVGAMTAPSLGRVLIVDDEVELMTALCESLTD